MAFSRNVSMVHGLHVEPAPAVRSADIPWLAAPLWIAILVTAVLWASVGWLSTLSLDAPDAVPADLLGIARPARFQPKAVPRGATHAISEPVTLLHSARVQQIVGVNGEYSINGRPFTAAAGMVWPGSVVRMRVRLAPGECEAQARLVVGGRSTVFRVEATGEPGCRPDARQAAAPAADSAAP
ncbi:hypothetical protein [Ramlibacter pallidus]|uniref:Type II secretion system protein GspC N-terminal domain-containing protein n=1 Tax=Ramlibacter pallidus TaxID=2780087 RepID=A0ABR9RZX6_9BURK|nr:hypothetical protein [Ramlibacter pallidus]MBE7366780.1 hypothetical protein [Ramlibacter pallidus]